MCIWTRKIISILQVEVNYCCLLEEPQPRNVLYKDINKWGLILYIQHVATVTTNTE